MTRMGPRMGPTAGPLMGPNANVAPAPAGFASDFDATSFGDGFVTMVPAVAHGLVSGDGPFRLTTTGTLPDPLQPATDYWFITGGGTGYGLDSGAFATSYANAVAEVQITLNDAGTGTHTMTYAG